VSIRIGDNNKIKNSSIGNQYSTQGGGGAPRGDKKFPEKHPILFSLIISLVAGFILLFSFWKPLVIWIENIFK
jgi:hypothetical protein